jgi:ankyrin repeat protein
MTLLNKRTINLFLFSCSQEGSRYNALHVAAKARNAEICSRILQTVGNVAFIQRLYGDDDIACCEDRARILVDLYLNTPDKALNETPLHFAVKFGAYSVVDVLVSYPQCDKHAKNKFGQAPRDVSNMYFHYFRKKRLK